DVAHATHHKHITDARSRLDAGARASRNQDHLAGAVAAEHAVRDGVAAELDAELAFHAALGVLGRLVHRGRHLVGLAVAVGHAAARVADHDEGVEAEATTTLDHGGATANLDDPVGQLVLLAWLAISLSGHVTSSRLYRERAVGTWYRTAALDFIADRCSLWRHVFNVPIPLGTLKTCRHSSLIARTEARPRVLPRPGP